jgi:hypothetical protein
MKKIRKKKPIAGPTIPQTALGLESAVEPLRKTTDTKTEAPISTNIMAGPIHNHCMW